MREVYSEFYDEYFYHAKQIGFNAEATSSVAIGEGGDAPKHATKYIR